MIFNLRYALRALLRSPAFTCAAVLSLALGIGANTAIFSIVNGLFLHPAGIENPERLLAPRITYKKLGLDRVEMSAPDFEDVQKSIKIFSQAALGEVGGFNYTGGESPLRLQGGTVTWRWFDVFGAKPILGRGFRPEEDQPGANHVSVLSEATWQRIFGGDRGILGRTVELNNELYRVVGVMPAAFRWPTGADLWTPIGLPAEYFALARRFNERYTVVARLRPGVPLRAADSYMNLLSKRIADSNPQIGSFIRRAEWSMNVEPFTQLADGNLRAPMLILLAAVGFVLLIACSNIAGLMLVRATGRMRELAIRTSLGATRAHLVKQAFGESLLLGGLGTVLGILLASLMLQAMITLAPREIATGVVIRLDIHVLGFAMLLGLATALLFGLAPAWHMSRLGQRYEQLKEGGRSDTEGRQRQGLRAALVAAQVALALLLLVGAGLFLKSLGNLRKVDTGFQAHGVQSASVALPVSQYSDEQKQAAFYRAVLDRLAANPALKSSAAISELPFSGGDPTASFTIEGRVNAPGDPGPHGGIRSISARYFETMRIPLRQGRYFNEGDRRNSQPVAIIDENLARQYWPHQNPLGKRLRNSKEDGWSTIVGIVAHVKQSQLAADTTKGVYYYPLYQHPENSVFFVARGGGGPSSLRQAIQKAVHAADPRQAVFNAKTMEERINFALGPRQFAVSLLTFFAAAALLLAALGLYGVISYNVSQRTRELGIRAALGAGRPQILGMVMRQAMQLVALGALCGLLAAVVLTRLVSTQLFEVSALDPLTFVGACLALLVAALLAAYLPAWRATRVDPMTALRAE